MSETLRCHRCGGTITSVPDGIAAHVTASTCRKCNPATGPGA